MSRSLLAWLTLVLLLAGCRGTPPLFERPKGEIAMRRPEALPEAIRVTPSTATLSQEGIDVTVRYASPEELEQFFLNRDVFGDLAGHNPYPDETLIFYVKVVNHSGKRIRVDPDHFVLIDNLNIQYTELNPDNISALYEARANVWSFAKTTGDMAPGPYGAPLKVAGALGGGKGRKLHYLIKQVRLAPGFIFPGIAYDGYVAFPRPHPNAASFRLLIYNIKTDYDASDTPARAVHFEFPLTLESVQP